MPSPTTSGATSSVGPSGYWVIDALLSNSGDDLATKWGTGPAGAGVTLTYSFPDGASPFVPAYGRGEPGHLIPLTPAQQEAAYEALTAWSAVANIDLVEVTESASRVGDIRIAAFPVVDPGRGPEDLGALGPTTYAYTYVLGPAPWAGDVWLDDVVSHDDYTPTPASHGYFILLHELGHALFGFEDVSAYPGLNGAALPAAYDSQKYTVMSYEPGAGPEIDHPTTPMLLDIAAAQYLYGPNMAHNAGDTVYRWDAGERIFETIWDGGGTDTIDWSNQTTAAGINLNAGAFSELGPPVRDGTPDGDPETLAIAYGAAIENAVGGTGDDEIIGNPHANALDGGPGDDVLTGGAGGDIFVFSPTFGADTITDFQCGPGGDVIDLTACGLGGFDALTVSTVDDAALIELPTGDGVLLAGVAAAQLHADDFWL